MLLFDFIGFKFTNVSVFVHFDESCLVTSFSDVAGEISFCVCATTDICDVLAAPDVIRGNRRHMRGVSVFIDFMIPFILGTDGSIEHTPLNVSFVV